MNISGLGSDVCRISRCADLLAKYPERFPARILTRTERAEAPLTPARLARRYAAKEAVAKALGSGIGAKVSFHDIILSHTSAGAPQVKIKGREGDTWHLSVSDDGDTAFAVAIVQRMED